MPLHDRRKLARTTRTILSGAFLVLAVAFLAPTATATQAPVYHTSGCITYHYVVAGVPFVDIPAALVPGSVLMVNFTLSAECAATLSFVSYNATQAVNPPLPPQTVFSSQTGEFGTGTAQLSIIVPPCFYQIDFVRGGVIRTFDPDQGVTYHDQERFIDGSTGGSACVTPSSSTTTTTSETQTTTDGIPVFPTGPSLALAVVGAGVAGLFLLRRRL